MHRKRVKFELKHTELIASLAAVGHKPRVRVLWSTGEGGGARVSLICDRCKKRRWRWLHERWQRLSPDKPCHNYP
jgi:hypothetical protein